MCGCRCSADASKCPECDFNIKYYFNNQHPRHTSFNKKYVAATIAIAAIAILGFIVIKSLLHTAPKTKEALTEASSESTADEEQKTVISNEVADTSTESNDTVADVVGVYSGDDHEILVINDDNFAYYYCAEKAYTELQCPWYIQNNKIYIEFSRLHCTVSASINNTDDFILQADPPNINWNAEVFTKLNVSPDDYLSKVITPYDKKATQNADGTMTLLFNGNSYTIPKEFADLESEFDTSDNCSTFVSIDPQNDYISALLFFTEPKLSGFNIDNDDVVPSFIANFFSRSTAKYYKNTTIHNLDADIYSINGILNENFSGYEGSDFTGFLAHIDNASNNSIDYIMLIESGGRNLSKGDKLLEIIDSLPTKTP